MELLLSLFVGIGLSATSGFRLFIPFLIMSIASLAGQLELSSGFEWIGSYPALIAFAVAALIEILAYLFPIIDNLVSMISAPVAVVAGTLITASVIVDLDPLFTWSLATIAGGGASLTSKTTSTLMHTGSTTLSGGTANPVVSTLETIYSTVMAVLSVLVPVLAIIFFGIILWIGIRLLKRYKRGRKQKI